MDIYLFAVLLLHFEGLFAAGASAPVFQQTAISTGRGARFVAVADVNHDGKLDLVVANTDSTVTVLLGDGKGHFRSARGSPAPAGPAPNDIAIADMNHDGNADLVIANHQTPYLTILLGDGRGGFAAAPGSPFDVHSSPHPHGVAVGSFSDPATLDVVTDSWGNNQIELLRGVGNGALRVPGQFFRVGRRPYERLRSADFNRDGHPDIVTTNMDDGAVTILLGDGRGGFHEAPGSPFAAGAKPWQVAIDDFNEDGVSDLAIIPYERDLSDARLNALTILIGDGKGGFTPMQGSPLSLAGCHGPNSVATGNVYGRKHRDILVSCAESKNLLLFERRADATFARLALPSSGGWGSVAVADLNGDGKDDLIFANEEAGGVTVYMSP